MSGQAHHLNDGQSDNWVTPDHQHQLWSGHLQPASPYSQSDNRKPTFNEARRIAGELGQADGVEGPLVTRPPTVTVLASPAGIISCHGWAAVCGSSLDPNRITDRRYRVPRTARRGQSSIARTTRSAVSRS